ncbi:MAG: D-alanyl-D-alanine carboxypeptidase [Dysosmobacter sp.]|nr:D-alanyl-D-alanine carboxypeptidase [Dysosmobacter sp.]
MDMDSGRVLYERNAGARMLIASTTKILTALVAIRDGNLSDTVKVSREAAYTEGSSMYLKEGEELTMETLVYGLLLCSGNDAAVAVAEHVGGRVGGFLERMNGTALELGMEDSSFANPNGLDDEEHYSTAYDMALLARAAMENETLVRIASTRTVSIGGRTMTNHNKLLGYMDGCLGLKTGYTRAAGRTLVSCAERGGQRLIAVTLQDGNDWADHQSLYDYGFAAYPAKRMAQLGHELVKKDGIPLIAADSFAWPLAGGEALETAVELDRELAAPLRAGTRVG